MYRRAMGDANTDLLNSVDGNPVVGDATNSVLMSAPAVTAAPPSLVLDTTGNALTLDYGSLVNNPTLQPTANANSMWYAIAAVGGLVLLVALFKR